MRARPASAVGRVAAVHPFQWLWEPLLDDPAFVLRPMFGGKSAYLDGRMIFYFAAKVEPWRGVLVCTDRPRHAALLADFPELAPHPVLPKWLYLPESIERFETVALRLIELARRRDPRMGVTPSPTRRRKKSSARRRGGLSSHP